MREGSDKFGQSANPYLRRTANIEKSVEHLLGICAGILADNKLTIEEALFLDAWIKTHAEVAQNFLGLEVWKSVQKAAADRVISEEELAFLYQQLRKIVGCSYSESNDEEYEDSKETLAPTKIFLDDPEPPVLFEGKKFCFTGQFQDMNREECLSLISRLKGLNCEIVNKGCY